MDSNALIIVIALGARFLNGLVFDFEINKAISFFMTPLYAYIPILYADDI